MDFQDMSSVLDITVTRITFIEIIQNVLITESVNITVVGGPTLIEGPSGKVIQLDGSSQYLDLGTQSSTHSV
jgi:hypothetical protein